MTNMIEIQNGAKLITMTVSDAVSSARKDAARKAEGGWISEKIFNATVEKLASLGIDYVTYEPTQADIKAAPSPSSPRRTIHPARMAAAMEYDAGDINNLLRSNGNAAAAE